MAKRISRKQFLKWGAMLGGGAMLPLPLRALQQQASSNEITAEDLKSAEKIAAIEFADEDRGAVLAGVRQLPGKFRQIRAYDSENSIEPPCTFVPFGAEPQEGGISVRPAPVSGLARTSDLDAMAYTSVREWAHLIRTRQISPVELTLMYLDRMDRFGDKLLCLVTLTEERAMEQAKRAESEIMAGRYLGPLHGIPYGLKDLFAAKGYPTTWGSEPHKDQMFDYDAAVVEKLDAAGAVLVAKLSMGSLAYNDVWFKGRTKNPWNPEQGSSGSSAGSACATAAGLVAFSLGTETLGSIVSPSVRCRVTGLRPTYGRVSRYGAMELSWTMDKIGPICRQAEDCVLVLAAIIGRDDRDPSTYNSRFSYRTRADLKGMRIGYLYSGEQEPSVSSDDAAQKLIGMGAELIPKRLPRMPQAIQTVLEVEAAAAFDDFTLGDGIHELRDSIWPNSFRTSRYIPAVEYLRAQRARARLMREYDEVVRGFDLCYAPQNGGSALSITNYTGHPQILVPNGTAANGNPQSISFFGRLFEEEAILAVANAYQGVTDHHKKKPDLSAL